MILAGYRSLGPWNFASAIVYSSLIFSLHIILWEEGFKSPNLGNSLHIISPFMVGAYHGPDIPQNSMMMCMMTYYYADHLGG